MKIKKSTSLAIIALIMIIVPAVWIGSVYGWQTVAAVFFWQWGINLQNRATNTRSKTNA